MNKETKKIISLVLASMVFFALFAIPVISNFVHKNINPIKISKDPDDNKFKPIQPDKDLLSKGAIPKSLIIKPKKKHFSKVDPLNILNIIGSMCSVISFAWAITIWSKTRKKEG